MEQILIKYEGYDADEHEIDLRLLGKSIVGLERIISSGFVLFEHGRWIRRKEQLPLLLRAKEPRKSSFELPVLFGHLGGVLPLLHQALTDKVHEMAWEWLNWVMASLSDRKKEADPHFESLMALNREMMDRHERSEREQREFLLQTLDKSLAFAKDAVAPVGPSCKSINFGIGDHGKQFDIPDAEKIRAKKDTKLDDEREFRLRIDGLIIHNHRLQVELASEPGQYIPAEVKDPIYDELPNPYMEAIKDQRLIRVRAKAELKFGEISKLYIMSFLGND